MDIHSENNFPWELISGSFTGTLTPEENLKLGQWLSSSKKNVEEYGKIKKLWEESLEDYSIYIKADENKAWNSLTGKLKHADLKSEVTPNIRVFKSLIALAAGILLLIGISWLLLRVNNEVFESTNSEGKNIVLKDGSIVILQPNTKLKVPSTYNKTDRTLILITGEAYFKTIHNNEKTFIVKLGTTQVRDIGTSFRIRKGTREINIDVISGKVEFRKTDRSESRLLVGGNKITYDIRKEQFGTITDDTPSLNFDNTPISEAIWNIRKVYHVSIVLADKNISNRRITANLEGMELPTVLEVICRTLNLEYSIKDGSYIINDKMQEQQ